MSHPVAPRGEHNDPDPPIDADPGPSAAERHAERAFNDHTSYCSRCLAEPAEDCARALALWEAWEHAR